METLTLDWPDEGIALLTLNRPERLNAINLAMYEELEDTLDLLAADRSARGTRTRDQRPGDGHGTDVRRDRRPRHRSPAVDRTPSGCA